jgi:hypothetical protein
MEITAVSESEDELAVAVGPGVAVDGYGRPIQVDRQSETTLPPPEADVISLYVRYSERPAESAPVPEAVDGEGESAVNRTVEGFEVTYRTGRPTGSDGRRGPDLDDIGETEDVARALVARYHERHRTDPSVPEDPAVFVGAFERTDDEWERIEGHSRDYAVDQELLFTALVDHFTDEERHGRGGSDASGGPARDVDERLNRLESAVAELEADRDALARHAVGRSRSWRSRRFERLATRLEGQDSTGSRLAREIASAGDTDPSARTVDEAAFRASLEELREPLADLATALDGVCSRPALENYRTALSSLESALEADAPLLEVVEAHDRLCERADSLSVPVEVVPANR